MFSITAAKRKELNYKTGKKQMTERLYEHNFEYFIKNDIVKILRDVHI